MLESKLYLFSEISYQVNKYIMPEGRIHIFDTVKTVFE